jgi:hypothetical protein
LSSRLVSKKLKFKIPETVILPVVLYGYETWSFTLREEQDEVGGTCGTGEGRGVYRVLVGRPDGKKPLGRSRRRWKDNIKLHLREIGIDGGTGFSWLRIGSSGGVL